MKKRRPIFNSALNLLLFAATAGISGCNAIMGSLMAPDVTPTVEGQWQGRIGIVTVYDDDGRAYQALALETIHGPTVADMRSSWQGASEVKVSEARGGGTLPLLARWKQSETCRLIDPSSLSAGQLVEVSGRMTLASTDVAKEYDSANIRVSREKWGEYPAAEHVIIINGPVKVLR